MLNNQRVNIPNLFLDYPSPAAPGAPGASNGPCLVCRPRLFASTWSSPPPRSVGWASPEPVPRWCSGHKMGGPGQGGKGGEVSGKILEKTKKLLIQQLKDISIYLSHAKDYWKFGVLSFDKCNKHLRSHLPKPFQARHIFTHKAMKVTSSYIHCVMWSSHVVGALFRPSCLMVIPYFFDCETTTFFPVKSIFSKLNHHVWF